MRNQVRFVPFWYAARGVLARRAGLRLPVGLRDGILASADTFYVAAKPLA